jgi:hypothetical protein
MRKVYRRIRSGDIGILCRSRSWWDAIRTLSHVSRNPLLTAELQLGFHLLRRCRRAKDMWSGRSSCLCANEWDIRRQRNVGRNSGQWVSLGSAKCQRASPGSGQYPPGNLR